MAAIVWADVVALAPSLSTVAEAAQTLILAGVNTQLLPDEIDGETGPNTKLARIYLAAHAAIMHGFGSAGTTGPVSMDHAGGLSVQYASAASASGLAALAESTPYGKLYKLILSRSPARAPRVP